MKSRASKIRRPRDTRDFYVGTMRNKGLVALYQDDNGDSIRLNLKNAKRLHKWLGRAIVYLESRK